MAAASEDLALALELADLADSITMSRFRAADLVVETKPDLTPVTEADQAVEQAVRAQLAKARVGDAVVGEEYGGSGPATGDRRWIVDPIDGTKSYVRGLPVWATLIALEVSGAVELGVVSAPALRGRWWAVRGEGAYTTGGARLRVSGVRELADAQLAHGGLEDWASIGRLDALLELARRCWRSRGFGDYWQYMLVAEGAADIALDPSVSLWDLAAVQIIVEEAGGCFTDFAGEPRADGGDGLATNGLLHEAVLAVVRR